MTLIELQAIRDEFAAKNDHVARNLMEGVIGRFLEIDVYHDLRCASAWLEDERKAND